MSAIGLGLSSEESAEIGRLSALGLPPISSRTALCAMIGINPGLLWSFENRPTRHYRTFFLPKGGGRRRIDAPRVALKVVQKWLSFHFGRLYQPHAHVFGFVPGMSHLLAAKRHLQARWVFSVDIESFFQSTPETYVADGLVALGYRECSALLIARICCFRDALAQGAPSSPPLSNLLFSVVDDRLSAMANANEFRLSRYADDIVLSGLGAAPNNIEDAVRGCLAGTPWRLSERKTELCIAPARLKVHGLLVSGQQLRLTKGYRNKVRAYSHLLATRRVAEKDLPRLLGHLEYAKQVESASR